MTSDDGTFSSSNLPSGGTAQSDENDDDSTTPVTFLYRLVEGVAQRSYGLNVARLAGIPRDILEVATAKSRELEIEITSKRSGKFTSQNKIFLLDGKQS